MSVTVTGADTTAAALRQAGAQLGALPTAHTQASQIIAAAAAPPVITGRLRAAIRAEPTADSARVIADIRYAVYVEARTHFLRNAVASTAPQWMAAYRADVARICEAA